MLVFLLGALRAIVEMLGMCLLAQGALYVLSGQNRQQNPIYRLFALLTEGPRKLLRMAVGARPSNGLVSLLSFLVLFVLWIGLALLRKLL